MNRRVLAFAALACAPAACWLDTSGLTGRAPDASDAAPPSDAAFDATLDAAGDAAPDAATDAPSDAPASDAPAGDARAQGSPCDGGAYLFCDDFDERDAARGSWDQLTTTGTGALALDSTDRVSPPNSLFASVAAHGGDAMKQETLGKTLQLAGATTVTIELDLEISYDQSQVSSTAGSYGWVLTLDDGAHFESLDIEKDDIAFDMQSFGGAGNPNLSVPALLPPNGAWHHVVLAMRYDATNGGASVTVDGQTVQSFGMNTIGTSAPTHVIVTVGVMTDATKGPWPEAHARFDDVLVR